jgi:PAS domain S-box-containing protein
MVEQGFDAFMKPLHEGQLLAQINSLRWFVAVAIPGTALGSRLVFQDITARQWPHLAWAPDVLFYGLVGGAIAWLSLTWISRKLRYPPREAERLASLVRNSPDAIIGLDEQWAIRTWNHSAELMFGYRRREILGQPFQKLLDQNSGGIVEPEATEKLIEERGYVQNRELDMITKDGKPIVAQLTGSILGDGSRGPSGFSIIVRDITAARQAQETLRSQYEEIEQKMRERTRKLELARHELEMRNAQLHRTSEDLKQLDHLKSDFVSMVSHELRSPLTNIAGAIELMLQEEELSDEYVRKMLGIMGEQSERLIRLVKGVLDISRIRGGRLHLDRTEVDILAVMERVVTTVQPTTAFHWFELPTVDHCPRVWGDEDRMEEIVFNLLDNAIKFSPAGGPVKVAMEVSQGEITVSITDPGIGIAPAKLDTIFQKFHRLDSEDSRETYGHGLGLYITKALVEAHGGSIGVESVEGEGSTFSFTLPLVSKDCLPPDGDLADPVAQEDDVQ